MRASARILGQDYGLTAEEMNCLLVKEGFLEGVPGDYRPTCKAEPYVHEKYESRGTGGSFLYNRGWVETTYDESIKDELVITPELIQLVKNEVAERRRQRWDEIVANRRAASQAFLGKQQQSEIEIHAESAGLSTAGKVGIAAGVAAGAVGMYFLIKKVVYPKLKNWWEKRKNDKEEATHNEEDY